MHKLVRVSFAALALLLVLAGCDASSPEDEAEDFSLDALEVSVSTETSDSQNASTETAATEISHTIKVTNTNETEAVDVTVVVNLYAHEMRPDGFCSPCGDHVASGHGGAQTIPPGETITDRGTAVVGGDFDGELCYEYELEAAPENGDLESKSYGGSCENVDWR